MVNAQLRLLSATAVAADFVDRQMTRSRSRRIVLFLDCCYAGAFVPRAKLGGCLISVLGRDLRRWC